MTIINATTARERLFKLIEEANATSEPVTITSKKGNAVLISEADFRAMQETMYLNSVPGLVDSILAAEKDEDFVDINEVDLDAL